MPFDGRDNTPSLNRARLIEALRAEMPHGYTWDFRMIGGGKCGCAMGLAFRLNLVSQDQYFLVALGITDREVSQVFGTPPHPETYGTADPEAITPAMVADALERLT